MRFAVCPEQIAGEFTVTVGDGVTVTVETAVFEQPDVVPVTVYVAVLEGAAVAVFVPVTVVPPDQV